jgi:hypothetical protein
MTEEIKASLNATKQWVTAVRNISALRNGLSLTDSEVLHLPYDVNTWYAEGDNSDSLTSYRKPVSYRIFYDVEEIERFLSEAEKLFGEELIYRIGKLLVYCSVSKLWRKCEPVAKESSIC